MVLISPLLAALCRSPLPRALVKLIENGWSARMQMTGQVECKQVVKWSAISHWADNGRSEGEERLISGEDIKDIAAPVK